MTTFVGRLSLDLVASELSSVEHLEAWLADSVLEVEGVICTPRELQSARRVARAVEAGAQAARKIGGGGIGNRLREWDSGGQVVERLCQARPPRSRNLHKSTPCAKHVAPDFW